MELPLGPSLANAFLAYHKQNWLDRCPLEYRSLYACVSDLKCKERAIALKWPI